MKLKLTKKGADRIDIETMEYDPRDHVFESDDFEGVVVLTVKEAKEIIGTYIGTHYEVVKKHGSSELKWILNLLDRIEQAEKVE